MKDCKFFSIEVNYNNCPDVFTYYFRAKSAREVSKATGIATDRIRECSRAVIAKLAPHTHIDTVVNGRLIEEV